MNFLITGGAGFIGSHLSERLLDEGHRVAIIDDLSTGSVRNVSHLRKHPKFECVIDTMMNAPILAELVDDADVVFHLAAAVGVKLIVESPARTIETNIQCTERVLHAAAKKKKPVVITSSSEVYGKSTAIPFREDGDLVLGATSRGRWSYACSKAIDEFLALAYYKEKKLPTILVRLFNTVGPRQASQYGMVIPRFVSQAMADRPLTVYGDGTQSRCFTHVSDVVTALVGLVKAETYGEVYNIGHTQEVTMLALAEKIKALVGSSSEITFVPYDQAYESNFEDMARRVPSTEKIHRAIGWAPSLELDEILASIVDYHRSEGLHSLRTA